MLRNAFALSLLALATPAAAAPKKAAKKEEPVQLAAPAALESVNALLQKWRCGALDPAKCPIKTAPTSVLEGFSWGTSRRQVLDVYVRGGGLIDQKFEPQLAKANPSAQKDLEAARTMDRDAASTQELFEFDGKPNGLDATFLWKSREYSKANGETCFKLSGGLGVGAIDPRVVRYFFFFGGKGDAQGLWKVYEELPLGANSPFGADFQDAVNKLSSTFGTVGRLRTAGQGEGLASTQIDWEDEYVHVRLVERPDSPRVVGFVVEDRKTFENLAALRANKPEDPFALDPSVAGATSGGISDPNSERAGGAAPEAPKGKDKGKDKGKKKAGK
jgi:hypothetical protein